MAILNKQQLPDISVSNLIKSTLSGVFFSCRTFLMFCDNPIKKSYFYMLYAKKTKQSITHCFCSVSCELKNFPP